MTKKRSFSSFQRAESAAERFCRFLIMKKAVLLLSLRRKDGRFPALTDCGFCDCIKRCFLHNSGGTVGFCSPRFGVKEHLFLFCKLTIRSKQSERI